MNFPVVGITYTKPEKKKERETRLFVQKQLQKRGIHFFIVERNKISYMTFKKAGFVIPIGGDGTFLATAQHLLDGTPILGVNADVQTKEGCLLSATKKTFSSLLQQLVEKKEKKVEFSTLEAKVNGKKIGVHAINEFYIGAAKAYMTSRYQLKLKQKKEIQRSSGLIVCTPQGVNAWANSVYGKKIHLLPKHFAYIVREPYEGKVFSNYALKKGVLKERERISFISKMKGAVLVADSLAKEYPLKADDTVEVTLSKKTIKVIGHSLNGKKGHMHEPLEKNTTNNGF